MFTMYFDYLNTWLLHNIKTMQIYKFTHNPVLVLIVHQPDRVSGRFIANRHANLTECQGGLLLTDMIIMNNYGQSMFVL